MKFWLTLVVGVVVVTGISTALYILNPDMAPPPTKELTPSPTGPTGVAVPDALEKNELNQPQRHKGTTRFEIKNEGDGVLELVPTAPNCTCSGVEVATIPKSGVGVREYIRLSPLEHNKGFDRSASPHDLQVVRVAPGDAAEVIMEWDTKEREGEVGVQAPIKTNTVQGDLVLRVVIEVVRDLIVNPKDISFGDISEGTKTERTTYVYSTLHDNLELKDFVVSTQAITTRIDPIEEAKKTELKAKSGYILTVATDGALPVGFFTERVKFKTNLMATPEWSLQANGRVEGGMTLSPTRVDFGVLPDSKDHVRQVNVFAKGLPEGDELKIGASEPGFIAIEFFNDPQFKAVWRLKVTIPANSPVGPFEGNVSIVDKAGNKKLNLPITGAIANSATGN